MEKSGPSLEDCFKHFAGGTKEMDGRQFAKLCKDCALLDKKFTPTDVDLIFAKIKDKAARKITFGQFQSGLTHIATKKGVSQSDIANQIESAGGPKYAGTKADFVKFHDDKSLYTGVYAKGGPSTVDIGGSGKIGDISELCDRSSADVRGTKK